MRVCSHREAMPADSDERLVLALFRFIGAAYETGDAACWEAAHERADAARGLIDGSVLVAQAAAVVRLIRAERMRFEFLPPPCRWLSSDETLLMRLLRRSRHGEAVPCAQHILASADGSERLLTVARALTEDAPRRYRPPVPRVRSRAGVPIRVPRLGGA